uniref:Integrase, catalytic region, zinc finger, CCHC-type, peptidase aspartic, catalytic n=1 Tax=Tanacetum cinerariifolium TaxID=118510 RepID=A0A6L2L3S9_TANCI|nr:integrase, catalytic region, zinc finger, CCHC-type, peptidase aspartic, catalytic [Tanacetum cinerariifolium]
MTTLADKVILLGVDNRPPKMEKDIYVSWKSRMELYMMNRQHGRMILESVKNGPLIWPSIEENGVTQPKKYSELSATKAIQDDCDVKATNIILQGLPPKVYALVSNHKVAKELWERIQLLMQGTLLMKQERKCKLYDEFDKFTYKKGESLHKVRLMHERNSNPLALVVTHQMTQDESWFKDKVLLVQAQANGQILHEEELVFLADPRITEAQTTQIVITHIFACQADDLDTYSFDCDEINTAKVALMANLSHYGYDDLAEVHNQDNMTHNLINQAVQAMPLSEQSNIMNQSVTEITSDSNIIPYSQYNSMNSKKPNPSTRPTKVEVPKELPKVSMVNTSFKKLKHHLASFDVVIKERTTATTITEGTWGFEHTKACFRDEIIPFVKALKDLFNSFDQLLIEELSEVQNVFHQMEQAVEQHRVESNRFQVKMKKVLNKNERLLEQVKLKERIKSLSGNIRKDKIKQELEEIKTINIELDHRVTKLIADEHLKQTYKQLYDSIKSSRIRSKEQCDDLIKQVNINSVKNSDLNASLQEKVLVITALKDNLRKLKGKVVVNEAVILHPIDPELLKINVAPLAPKLQNNRTAHSDYLKHTQEETVNLREIVKHKRSLNLLNTSLDYSFSNKPMLSSIGVNLSTSASGSQPSGNTKKDKIQTFTIVGNACPLTRITTTAKVPLRKPIALESNTPKPVVVQIVLWYLDSGCSKHMTGDRSQLTNFVNKFLGTIKFGNDHVAKIMGYDDYQIGNVTILRVYFVDGLGHKLFSIGQFCDSDLEVSFHQHTYFIRNVEGVDLLTGSL